MDSLKKYSKKALIIAAHPDDESLFMGGTIASFKKWRWTILCVTDCDMRYNKRRRQELSKACCVYTKGGSRVKPFFIGLVKLHGLMVRLRSPSFEHIRLRSVFALSAIERANHPELVEGQPRLLYFRDFVERNPAPVPLNGTGAWVKKKGRFSKPEAAKRIRSFIDEFGPFDFVFTHGNKGDYGHKTHKLIYDAVNGLRLKNLYNFITPSKESISTLSRAKSRKYIHSVSISPQSRRIKKQALNIYLKGSQKTNLAKLKKILTYALNTPREYFIKANQHNILSQ